MTPEQLAEQNAIADARQRAVVDADLRDRFAMAALQGLLSSSASWKELDCTPMHGENVPQVNARWAYQQADAMLRARRK